MLKLSVFIPCRDRIILTKKCIDSIWKNSGIFDKINIYVFDNMSEFSKERFEYFSGLLESKRICYYSYDTRDSLTNCFGKAVCWNRWINMMERSRDTIQCIPNNRFKADEDYYLLIDNDFVIVDDRWGEYFVSAAKQTHVACKDTHFLVPSPGGVPERYRGEDKPEYTFKNLFNEKETLKVKMANGGGSSGFWFLDHKMLLKMKWDSLAFTRVYSHEKRHDTETWNLIRRKKGSILYVGGVHSTPTSPIALHLGSVCGSVCNQLSKNNYEESKHQISNAEQKFKDLSVDDIKNMYGESCSSW